MQLIIRQAELQEGPILAAIEAQCFPAAEAASSEQIAERMDAFLQNFVVAELNEKVVGFINGGATDQPYLPDEMYHEVRLHKPSGAYQTVFGLNVLPEYRKHGIAGKILEEFTGLARKRGKKGVILTCKEHMIPFYEKRGFVKYGVSDSCHGGAVWYDMRLLFPQA